MPETPSPRLVTVREFLDAPLMNSGSSAVARHQQDDLDLSTGPGGYGSQL